MAQDDEVVAEKESVDATCETKNDCKKYDYKSRKFVLTAVSLALFIVLIVNGYITGDQFVNLYWMTFASYVVGNVGAIVAKKNAEEK